MENKAFVATKLEVSLGINDENWPYAEFRAEDPPYAPAFWFRVVNSPSGLFVQFITLDGRRWAVPARDVLADLQGVIDRCEAWAPKGPLPDPE